MVFHEAVTPDVLGFLPSSQQETDTGPQQQQTIARRKAHGKKKLLIILHGKRIDDDTVRHAIEQIRADGHEVQVRVTWDSGDVDCFVREAIELWDTQSYDTLVAGGGDGTLNELVAALLKHDAPQHISVAQLPLGTANDLASATGISLHPVDALRLALDPANIHPIDIALVNGEVFMNLTTAGPVSEVSSKGMSDALKKTLGPAAVAVAGFRQLLITGLQPLKNVRITYPTSVNTTPKSYHPEQVAQLRGDLLVLAAGQARQMGRMINVCPDALLDDGLLDFTILFGSATRQAADLASDILLQGFSQAQGGVQLLRVPWMIVEADQDLKCNRDGEPSPPSKRLVFEVIPRRINLHLPDSRLLVDGQAAAGVGEIPTAVDAGNRKLARSWSTNRKTAMRTGTKPRPRLLLDLWNAQQPPGRLSRLIPKAKKLLSKTVVYGALVGTGVAIGLSIHAHTFPPPPVQNLAKQHLRNEHAVAMGPNIGSIRDMGRDQTWDSYAHPFADDAVVQQEAAVRGLSVCTRVPQHASHGKVKVCSMPRLSLPVRTAPPLLHARLL